MAYIIKRNCKGKQMKRITKLLAVLLCAVLLTGCGGNMKQPPVNVEQSGVAEETKDATTQSEETAEDDAEESASVEVEESTSDEAEESAAENVEESTEESSTEVEQPEIKEEESKEPQSVKEEEEVMPDKFVALTFDDGPNTNTMVEVLDILAQEDVKATFYVIGSLINEPTGEVIKRAYEEGHEIGNHSKSHQDMTSMDADTLREEIDFVQVKVEELIGKKPATFRPPYIAINQLMHDAIELPFIVGVDSRDWDPNATGQDRYNNVVRGAKDGAIFLMHCMTGNSETVKVLPAIIKELRNQGYGFVTVSELFEMQGTKYEAHDGQRFSVLPKQK